MRNKLLIFATLLLLPMFVTAQNKKVALLQTLNGDKSIQVKGIEMNLVQGELRKAISNQSGFQAFTRTDIDQLMKEHGFQNSGMVSDAQRKKLGEMSGADYICVSKLTKNGLQFYLEAYLIDVETGEISNPASQFGILQGNTYANLYQLCVNLAKEMIADVDGSYSSNTTGLRPIAQGYVDLGLPSGTLWKAKDEGGFYDYNAAVSKFGGKLPSLDQWGELKDYCKWTWNGRCFKVSGENGKFIVLYPTGYRISEDSEYDIDRESGHFWSSQPDGSEGAVEFYCKLGAIGHVIVPRWTERSVRLVQKP